MYNITYINRKAITAGAFALLLSASSCSFFEVREVPDPNNPGVETVITNASLAQLNALATGTEASLRLGHTSNAPYNWVVGTLGREIVVLATNESRWYTELLGTRGTLDDAAYYNASYNDFARVGRAARVFRQSAQATAVVSEEQKQGIAGFTHTYEAISKLHLLNLQGENGIRMELDDYLKPGKFASQEASLANIRQLLDQGAAELDAAGATFSFTLSPGYAGFNTPATFKQVNRALAARVALYQKDYAGALTALGQSFYSRTGDLAVGPKITFNPATAGDQANSYFQLPNSTVAQLVTVPVQFVTGAEAGDARLAKVAERTTPRTLAGIEGRYEPRVFVSQTAPLDIIRNEELVLIAAEARLFTDDLTGALADLNAVRVRSGRLAPLAGTITIDQILKERQYSLFYEGHRWIDLRRTGRLVPSDSLPFSQGTFKLFDRMERPAAEKQWDIANP